MPRVSAEITCRRVDVEAIVPLRHRILRAELPVEMARFEHDLDPSTRHWAACRGEEPVTCLSLVASDWQGRPAWQLRGMATDSAEQGRGLGRRLLTEAVADARGVEPGRIFWCNARTSAIGFYERLGWRVVSAPFDVPTAGPHVKMVFEPASISRPPVAGFSAVELAFLVAAHALGGPPWVALGVLACCGQILADFRLPPLVGLVSAVAWAAAHRLTADRELFFPYALALAAHLAFQFAGRGRKAAACAASVIVVAFLAIRGGQAATPRVLAVELAVAAVIVAATAVVLPAVPRRQWAGAAVAALASLAAYAGLAL